MWQEQAVIHISTIFSISQNSKVPFLKSEPLTTRGRCIETGVFKYLMYTSGYLMFSGMPRKQKRRQKVHTPENLNLKKINNSQHI